MKLARTLTAAALAFSTGCATAPKVKPAPMPVAAAPTPAPAPAPAPKEPDAAELFASALASFEAGDYDASRKGFEKVLEKAPQSVNAQFNLGLIAERQGRFADAQAAYEKVLFLEPAHGPSLLNLGKLYRNQEKYEQAISLYEKALKTPGLEHNVSLLNNLTVAYRLAKKFDLAEATVRRVLARSKDNAEAYKNLALIYYDQGQYRLAEVVSANARKLDEKDPGIYNNLGMIYLKLNDRPRALAEFQKAVSLDEKFAPGYLNIGAMALSYRDYVGAERAFAHAVQLDPTSYEGQLYLAYALDGQKGRDPKKGLAAGEAFEKVLALRADHAEAICGAGWAYSAERTGWEKAISFLERCKAQDSTAAEQKQAIDTKVQSLQAMLKSGQPQPAAEQPEKKETPQAVGGAGGQTSIVDKVSDQAAQQEGVQPEQAAPASDAQTESAPKGETAPAPAQ